MCDLLGTKMMVVVFKQAGMVACDRDRLKIVVKTEEN